MGETTSSLGYYSLLVTDSLNSGLPSEESQQTIPQDYVGFNAYVAQAQYQELSRLSSGLSQTSSTPTAQPAQVASASPVQGSPVYELNISLENGVTLIPTGAVVLLGCGGKDKEDDSAVEKPEETKVKVYYDGDGDGYGDPDNSKEVTESELTKARTSSDASTYSDADGDYVTDDTDCDDTNPGIHPGATEVCDGEDDDCDGAVDGDDSDMEAETYWYDGDGDGYGDGNADTAVSATCADAPANYVPADQDGDGDEDVDCDDTDSYIPGVGEEICNGRDDDCDGEIDEDLPQDDWYTDADGDGYGDNSTGQTVCEGAHTGDPNYSTTGGDCDDTNANVNPGAIEVTENGVDDDCDTETADEAAVATWSGDNNVSDYTIKLSGVSAKDYAGTLANGVDVDGDGYSDIMVGAYKYNAGNGYGNAYLVKGPITSSGTLSAKADASVAGSTRDDYVGYDLAMTSDYDGSGTPFAAIAGSKYSTYGAVGLVDLTGVSGSIAFSSSDLLINGESSYRYPNAVTIGDVTGDGYDQALLIGDAASSGSSSGAAMLFNEALTSGSVDLSDADSIFYGTGKDQAGGKVGLGDVDGDGNDDVVVASISANGTAGCISSLSYECAGSVAVFTDSVSGSVSTEDSTASIYGDLNSGNLGSALSAGTDLDGDGYGDLVLGAYSYNDSVSSGSGSGPGAVYLVLGASDMSTKVDTATDLATLTIYGNEEGDDGGVAEENKDLGYAVLAMEMTEPVLVYSVDALAGGVESDKNGEVRLLYYPVESSGTYYAYDEDSYDAIFRGSSSEYLGTILANAGDTDADGYDDLLIGALRADSTTGAAYLLSGTP